ncbi:hypothetical protein R5H30_14210 [Sulfitobacter sp. D35]|uniref:hypothetical protein n=1 Tax=Sulfitobacter sp. D35 TaxID=3083252 RepID=UPI00296F3382|nr:hypothetical protein [Sulfitobacter sp. D35]MDW4499146.1 hypothetical protein [Sulfitobacter sp. D35]
MKILSVDECAEGVTVEKAEFDPLSLDMLPYGVWTTAGGTEVMFNRGYQGVWIRDEKKRNPRMILKPKHMSEIARTSYTERYFRDDGQHNPRHDRAAQRRCREIIATFITGKSIKGYLI